MLTVYDPVHSPLKAVRPLEYEKDAEQYYDERRERSRILDEHAEYLRALITIDDLLEQTRDYPLLQERTRIFVNRMREAMPSSIVATRKE